MNLVRSIITVFLVVVFLLCVAGWIWAGGQPPSAMRGSRFVLSLAGLASLGSLWLLWSARAPRINGVDAT